MRPGARARLISPGSSSFAVPSSYARLGKRHARIGGRGNCHGTHAGLSVLRSRMRHRSAEAGERDLRGGHRPPTLQS